MQIVSRIKTAFGIELPAYFLLLIQTLRNTAKRIDKLLAKVALTSETSV